MSSENLPVFPNGIDEKYYHLMLDSSLEGILTLDANFIITYANPKICSLLNYSSAELIGKNLQAIIPSKEWDDNQTRFQNRSQGKSESYERSFVGKSGKVFYCLVTAIPYFDKGSNFQGSFALIKDFTSQHAHIEKTMRSQKTYAALIESLPDIVIRLDSDFHILYINEAVRALQNQPASFYTGKAISELNIPTALLVIWNKQLKTAFQKKEETIFDFDMMTPQGPHHFETRIVPEFTVEGSIDSVFCIIRDFSAKIEQFTHQNETDQKLKTIIEQVAESFIVHDENGKLLDVNQHACEILGYTRQELLNLSLFDIESDLDPGIAQGHWREARLGHTVTRYGHFKCKNGTLIPIETRVGCFEQGDQKVFVGVSRDISLREEAENSLLQVSKRLQLAAEAAHAGIWEWEIQKDHLIWDDRMFELYGQKREAFNPIYKSWFDTLLPEDAIDANEKMKLAVTKEIPYDTHFRIRWPNGDVRTIKAFGRLVKDSTGQPQHMMGVNYDITQDKWVEKASLLMAEAIQQIASATTPHQINAIVGQKLLEMIEDGSIVVSELDEDIQGTRIKFLSGTNPLLEKIKKEFPVDLSQTVFSLKDYPLEVLTALSSGHLIPYPDGLYNLLAKKAPKSTCKLIQKQLNINYISCIGYKWKESFFGSVVLFTSRDLAPIAALIEAVVNQAALSYKKLSYENLLAESENRFRRIFEESPLGIAVSNPDSLITDVNSAFSRILGYSREELLGLSYRKITHADDIAENDRLNREMLKGSIPYFSMPKRYIRKDGQIIWAKLTVTAIHSKEGNLISFLAMVEDITTQKQSQEALEHEKYLFQTLLDNSPDSVYFKDAEGCFLLVNPATAKKFGVASVNDLLGKSDIDFLSPELAAESRAEESEIIQTGNPIISAESIEVWKDNRPSTWASVTKMPLKDESGKIIGTFGITRDITERKSKEEEIKQLNADLEKRVEQRTKELKLRNEELESFVYSISHDLKAPLRGITGYAQLLVQEHDEQLDEEGKSFLQKLILSSNQLAQLVDDLLTYSRLDRRPVNWVKLNVAEIIGIVLDERSAEIAAKHITVHQNIEPETLTSSIELLTQTLKNLLDNAIKFSSTSDHPEIWIDYHNHGDTSLFSIRDTGIGFDMKYSEHIFDVFYRLVRVDEYPGTGIGLAIVKKAAKIIGGRVWAESEPEKGATFYLEITKNS